ncbi:MAG: 2'-5' RNA ligase family protein [Lachnospiraceae bacterium]|nr:2'-5' RNA ligase family protein [Lachnospiraceae bacterium]
MAEEFLTLMADLDDNSQRIMSDWYEKLKSEGFIGQQTPDLPFHISLACFSLDKEAEVVNEMNELAGQFSEIPVHISHIGLFAGGKVLYAAPDMNPADLLGLRQAIKTENNDKFPWTPHATIIIDEAETIQKALPILVEHFRPFMGKITKLHLCAFWPTREIASVSLTKQ